MASSLEAAKCAPAVVPRPEHGGEHKRRHQPAQPWHHPGSPESLCPGGRPAAVIAPGAAKAGAPRCEAALPESCLSLYPVRKATNLSPSLRTGKVRAKAGFDDL